MNGTDRLKVTLAGVIALAGIYLSTLELIASPVRIRFAIFFGSLAAAGVLMYFTAVGKEFIVYVRDTLVELRKIVWPEKDEVVKMTGVVLLFVTIVALFLWMVDGALGWLLNLITLG